MSTLGPEVVSNLPRENLASVSPCTHEEADTRMFVHVADHTFNGFTNVALRTTDSDVVVIAISVIKHLQELSELWIVFGTGKNFRYIPAHEIANQLGEARAGALPAFHSITGCDTVSALYGKGKKTAWAVWQQNPDVTFALRCLSAAPQMISAAVNASIQEFVVKLYDLDGTNVDVARMEGFYYQVCWSNFNFAYKVQSFSF